MAHRFLGQHLHLVDEAKISPTCLSLHLHLVDDLGLDVTGHHIVALQVHGVLCAALAHGAQLAHVLEHLCQRDGGLQEQRQGLASG
eukprot:1158269-Pelagomonas_calceolata.AAC.26